MTYGILAEGPNKVSINDGTLSSNSGIAVHAIATSAIMSRTRRSSATKLPRSRSTDIPAFIDRSLRLRTALAPHICAMLAKGISIVLDFPGNARTQRAWFRDLFERAHAEHELHFVDASDAICKRQLKDRTKHLAAGTRRWPLVLICRRWSEG